MKISEIMPAQYSHQIIFPSMLNWCETTTEKRRFEASLARALIDIQIGNLIRGSPIGWKCYRGFVMPLMAKFSQSSFSVGSQIHEGLRELAEKTFSISRNGGIVDTSFLDFIGSSILVMNKIEERFGFVGLGWQKWMEKLLAKEKMSLVEYHLIITDIYPFLARECITTCLEYREDHLEEVLPHFSGVIPDGSKILQRLAMMKLLSINTDIGYKMRRNIDMKSFFETGRVRDFELWHPVGRHLFSLCVPSESELRLASLGNDRHLCGWSGFDLGEDAKIHIWSVKSISKVKATFSPDTIDLHRKDLVFANVLDPSSYLILISDISGNIEILDLRGESHARTFLRIEAPSVSHPEKNCEKAPAVCGMAVCASVYLVKKQSLILVRMCGIIEERKLFGGADDGLILWSWLGVPIASSTAFDEAWFVILTDRGYVVTIMTSPLEIISILKLTSVADIENVSLKVVNKENTATLGGKDLLDLIAILQVDDDIILLVHLITGEILSTITSEPIKAEKSSIRFKVVNLDNDDSENCNFRIINCRDTLWTPPGKYQYCVVTGSNQNGSVDVWNISDPIPYEDALIYAGSVAILTNERNENREAFHLRLAGPPKSHDAIRCKSDVSGIYTNMKLSKKMARRTVALEPVISVVGLCPQNSNDQESFCPSIMVAAATERGVVDIYI